MTDGCDVIGGKEPRCRIGGGRQIRGVSPTDRSGAADRSGHRLVTVMLERWPVKRCGYTDPAFGGVGDHWVVTVGWFRLQGRRDRLMAVILLLPMIYA